MNKASSPKIICQNKKAPARYKILDKIEAGVILTGPETKSAKLGHISISDSYAKIMGGEIWLVGANIAHYKFSRKYQEPKRTRKLLLKKEQIIKLLAKLQKGINLIPTKVYLKKNLIKVELALAKSLKIYDQKRRKKEKELQREAERELKQKIT